MTRYQQFEAMSYDLGTMRMVNAVNQVLNIKARSIENRTRNKRILSDIFKDYRGKDGKKKGKNEI